MTDDNRSSTSPNETDDDRPPSRESRAGSQFDSASTIDVCVLDPRALVCARVRGAMQSLTARSLTHAGATGEIRIRLVDDPEMVRAHQQSHNDPSTTDVITYDLRERAEGPLDTDLTICVDEARRRSDDLDHPIEHELTLYAVHGALHCMGYDDQDPQDRARMHAREDELLSAIGIGPVYASREGGTLS